MATNLKKKEKSISIIYLDFPGGSVVKNLLAKQEMWIPSLGGKDLLEKLIKNPPANAGDT